MRNPEIRFVKNKDINYQKWDQCIASSTVPLIYVQSWYLDLISPNWDAFISDDYAFVMPLIIKRKFGISFLLQPIFAQQHGIFPETDIVTQNNFLSALYEKFKYITINLNASHCEPFPVGFKVQQRNNFILKLSPSNADLKANYSKHTRRQIRKAEENKVYVIKELHTSKYLELKIAANKNKLPQSTMQTLKCLIDYGQHQGSGMIYAAYNQHNMLCGAAYFFFDEKRVTYLNAVSTDEGKNINAMYKIVDQFILENSDTALTLDFEGSIIPGIARFYKGFGAETELYYCLKSNRLPIPLRWFKK